MHGLFISLEGTEGGGKTTQVTLVAERLRQLNRTVRVIREPGGTPIGEEIRHTLKHSEQNRAMTAEAELLLMNASRAQLVREVIRPALSSGEIVLCDRFYDSTVAYQGYGRQLSLRMVQSIIDFAVGDTRPQLTLLLMVPVSVSEARRRGRQQSTGPRVSASGKKATFRAGAPCHDRIEEAGREFFERVEQGYKAIAAAEPERVRVVDATRSIEAVQARIWELVEPLVREMNVSSAS
jgi:dTMP kinase